MIQFGLRAVIDRASSSKRFFGTWRGIIMMTVTNRMNVRALTAGVSTLLAMALLASFMLVGGASRALGDDTKTADVLKAIKGTWTSDADGIDSKWTFDGETLKASVNGVDYTCKVKFDTEAKPHATIDLNIEDGPDEAKGKVSKAIYKLDGEKLTLCVSLPGKDRPKAFEQAPDEAYLFDLKKQKKD
jgi:uncharacterized protein (TIGR03067 family)